MKREDKSSMRVPRNGEQINVQRDRGAAQARPHPLRATGQTRPADEGQAHWMTGAETVRRGEDRTQMTWSTPLLWWRVRCGSGEWRTWDWVQSSSGVGVGGYTARPGDGPVLQGEEGTAASSQSGCNGDCCYLMAGNKGGK